jgi:hypothetical protein
MYCSNCGSKLDDNVKFCSNCGTPITGNASPAPVPDVQTANEITSMPEYPKEVNGVTFNAVQVALDTKLFEKSGFTATIETADEIKKISGCGTWKSSSAATQMLNDETLKSIVKAYQSGRPLSVNINVDDGQLRCPQCHSAQIEIDKQGFSGGKALVGGLLTGGVGLIAGFHNKNKRKGKCLKCGYSWKI